MHKRRKSRKFLALLLLVPVLIALIVACTSCFGNQEANYPRGYSDIVTQEAKKNHLDEALVYAIIKAESNFKEDAVSRVGAVGLMQLMPETYEWLVRMRGDTDVTSDDIAKPAVNIRYGCYFLAYLGAKYTDIRTIAAAYNAGFGAVDKWLENPAYSTDGVHLINIPYPETASYAEIVAENYEKYIELYYSNEEDAA